MSILNQPTHIPPDEPEKLIVRLQLNLHRVSVLMEMAVERSCETTTPTDEESPYESDRGTQELYRAAVVLLHATFEDVIRTAAKAILRKLGSGALDDVGFPAATKSKERITLSELAQFRHMRVEDLIGQSIDECLDDRSFASIKAVAHLYHRLGIDFEPLRPHCAVLEWMMNRRHQIVHRADTIGDYPPEAAPITKSDMHKLRDECPKIVEYFAAPLVNRMVQLLTPTRT